MKNHIEIDAPREKKHVDPVDRGFRVIVHPHRKQAKPVQNYSDIEEEVEKMKVFIRRMNKHGYHGRSCLALAQPQINSENPLRYFVDMNDIVFINPKIREKDNLTKGGETCLSYPFRQKKKVRRYFNLKVEYFDKSMKKHTKDFEGLVSAIFQHEIDNFNGIYIYDL